MDIISHGLWGSVAFGRRNSNSFWASFLFGIMPDFVAFAPFFALAILGFYKFPKFSTEPPSPGIFPDYIFNLYSISHSLLIFGAAFLITWLILKRPFWEMSAWGLHILFDIPTHSDSFFPTPFLWPLSSFHVSGIPWADPIIFIPNVILLITLYLYFFVYKKKNELVSKNLN